MPIIPSGDPCSPPASAGFTSDDVQLLDLLALHVICGQLREALLRWLPAELEPDGANENAGASAEPAPLQLSQLTSLVGDDRAKIRRYLELFASSTGTLMGRIGASIDRREAPRLRRLSHTLKGACGNI